MKLRKPTAKDLEQRKRLDERLKGRKPPKNWRDDMGIPMLDEKP